VRSQGEKKIANLLYDRGIPYDYELEMYGGHPDFTVYAPDGKVYVWEYVGPGMLDQRDTVISWYHEDNFDRGEYLERLRYKFQRYRQLNPRIYRIIFTSHLMDISKVIDDLILGCHEEPFFVHLPGDYIVSPVISLVGKCPKTVATT
jgi:hypothetical protein